MTSVTLVTASGRCWSRNQKLFGLAGGCFPSAKGTLLAIRSPRKAAGRGNSQLGATVHLLSPTVR